MLTNAELENILHSSGEIDYAKVEGDGYHYQLLVVSDAFQGKSLVARQQWVYKKLQHLITTGTLHALTMKTMTKDEWEKQHG